MRFVQIAMWQELPPELQGRVPIIHGIPHSMETASIGAVIVSGVGKVSAATAIASVLTHFKGEHEVIATGFCGSLSAEFPPGYGIIADEILQHDFGASTSRGEWLGRPGERILPFEGSTLDSVLFKTDKSLREWLGSACKHADIKYSQGRIATGDNFITLPSVANGVRSRSRAVAIDMECGAVAQVCERMGARMAAVKIVSDVLGNSVEAQYLAALGKPSVAYRRLLTEICSPFLTD